MIKENDILPLFRKRIQKLSDDELSKSLNRMIKILSEIDDSIVDAWRKKDCEQKIKIMDEEWRKRGKKNLLIDNNT